MDRTTHDPYVAALEAALLDYVRRYGATDLARYAFRDPALWIAEARGMCIHDALESGDCNCDRGRQS